MPDDLVARLNAFTANKHPGHVGVSLTHCEATPVDARTTHVWDVEIKNENSGKVIALFRCTQMIPAPR